MLPFFFLNAQKPLSHLRVADGLSHDMVNHIGIDTTGFMWFSTFDGLTRYDGRQCVVFRHREDDSLSLPANHVYSTSTAPDGRMWVSTEKGLCSYQPATRNFRTLRLKHPGSSDWYTGPVSGLVFDKAGKAWFLTTGFLAEMNLSTLAVTWKAMPDSLKTAAGLVRDSRGRMWVNGNAGLYLYHEQNHTFELKLSKNHWDEKRRCIPGPVVEDHNRQIWAASWGKGLFMYDEAKGQFEDFPDGPLIITGIDYVPQPDSSTLFWCGGNASGLFMYHPKTNITINFTPNPYEPYAHNNTMARCIFRDKKRRIVWFGTENGVEKFDASELKFERQVINELAQDNQFTSLSGVEVDRNNPHLFYITVWGKGLIVWDRANKTFLKESSQTVLSNDELFDVEQDKDGNVWLAGFRNLDVYNPKTRTAKAIPLPEPLTPNINHKILDLHFSKDGKMWIATNYEGLYVMEKPFGPIRRVHLELDGKPLYPSLGIADVASDARGRILLANFNGFFRYDPATGKTQHLLKLENKQRRVHDFLNDPTGRLWVATNEGVHMLDENDRVRRTIDWRDGLDNQNVTGMEMDKDGRLWLATSNGLYRYDIKSGNMTRYGIQDGLFSNSLENAFHQTPEGELFMGFAYSFNVGRPQSMPVNMTPPKVVLDGIKVLNKARPLPTDGRLILRPGENVVSFDFAVINFTQSERNVLAYKLDGFDKTWTETQQNNITYTNLDGGTYTLLVRARNRDGVWSTNVYALKLKVIPPFYQTWWFRLLFMAFVAGIAAFVAWYRQQEKRRLDAIRRRIARDLHDDMGSTLSSIRFFSEVAQNKLGNSNPETSSLLQRIGQSAADLSEAMQDIVWAINVRFDKIDDLAMRMREFGIKVCEARGIQFVSDMPSSWPDWPLRPDQKRNIYLIYKEAVNNAAKYAQASEITVRLHLQGRNLRLDIRDNGRGFDTDETTPGNGLINMRQRALDIRGTLEITSHAGEGTQITLLTPLS